MNPALRNIVVALLIAMSHAAFAAEVSLGDLPSSDGVVDLTIPESPAFSALGLSPETVTRPSSPREFVGSLLSGLDPNGNFQAGLALDAAPYLLLWGENLTLRNYREHAVERLASRVQLSVATSRGAENADDSTRAALGFRWTPWDRGDPRLDYEDPDSLQACLEGIQLPTIIKAPPESKEHWKERVHAFAAGPSETMAAECHEKAKKRLWNRSAWDIAGAPSWIQKKNVTGKEDTDWNGGTVWTSLAYGFEGIKPLQETSQLIAIARLQFDQFEPVSGMNNVFARQDSATAGLRVRIGRPNLSFSLEGAYIYIDPEKHPIENSYRCAGETDIKLPFADQLWLNVGLGGTGSRGNDDKIFLLASLKWGAQSVNLGKLITALNPSVLSP